MKKGFTLIELLAVIVILAIIAVIAVPIVLNIIDESKDNARLRSAEMYVKAAELSIANSTLKDINIPDGEYTIKDGDICLDDTCTKKLKVEVNGEVPTSGEITITNGTISQVELNFKDQKTIVKNSEGKLVYQEGETIEKGKFSSVCKPVDGVEYNTTAGTKYTCEVKDGTSYTFYVLTTPQSGDTSINLIMDRNICEDGTPVTADNNCVVAYNSSGDAAGTGPVTAMTYLNNATSTWKNIDNLNIEYNDEGGNFSKFAINGKARMPYKNEVSDFNNNNGYLYENLDCFDDPDFYICIEGVNHIVGINGYWTLSSYAGGSSQAWNVFYDGDVLHLNVVGRDSEFGVRAVINLKI